MFSVFVLQVPCKIIHITSGGELKHHAEMIMSHFKENGSPIMMGGDSDAASKGIMGIARSNSSYYLLILVSDHTIVILYSYISVPKTLGSLFCLGHPASLLFEVVCT